MAYFIKKVLGDSYLALTIEKSKFLNPKDRMDWLKSYENLKNQFFRFWRHEQKLDVLLTPLASYPVPNSDSSSDHLISIPTYAVVTNGL